MNINILGYENKIEFEQGYVNIVEISNKQTFANLVSEFNELCNNKEYETNIITLHGNDNEILQFAKEAEIVIDIFNLDLNSKKIMTKLYNKIESNIENIEQIDEQIIKLKQLIFSNVQELPFSFNISTEIKMSSLLKLYDIKINENMYIDLKEKLTIIVDIISELELAQILIIPNLKSYLIDEELIELYKYTMYKDLKLIIIDNILDKNILKYEKKMQIDDNYDDIMISYK